MALPSGYEYADFLYRHADTSPTPYFDLGVPQTSTLKFSALFDVGGDNKMYLFGSRATDSTSSAQQFNLYYGGQSAATQLGYAGARISLGNDALADGACSFQKDSNQFTINNGNMTIIEKTGATTTFTGTRNMYLFGCNSGGNLVQGSGAWYDEYANIKTEDVVSGQTVKHNFLPVYDYVNNEQCIYDAETDTIIQKSGSGSWYSRADKNTHYLLTVDKTDGGLAYVETKYGMQLNKLYCHHAFPYVISEQTVKFEENDEYYWSYARVCARPNNGYSFVGWEYDGTIMSKSETAYIIIGDDVTIKAIFVKNADDVGKNNHQLVGLRYGTTASTSLSNRYVFAEVLSSNLNVDGMSKTTSTIVCKEISSDLLVNTVVFLKNPKGKIVYIGIVNSINDKTITCREPLGLFDSEFLFHQTSSSTNSLMYAIRKYIADYTHGYPDDTETYEHLNYSVIRKMNTSTTAINREVSIDNASNMNITSPIISSTNISNLEDYVLNAFDEFGIYVDSRLYMDKTNRDYPPFARLKFDVINPRLKQPIKVGNNVECVTNVDIDVQDIENTVLQIYNSTGSTLRGIYSVKFDGTITEYPLPYSNFIAYDSCKLKVVMSDDKLNVLLEQYLSSAKYNHKITFDLDLNSSLYSLDDFSIGRRVDFYYNDKVYNSIVTGKSWEIPENTEDPSHVKITLGKVRNKLTIKLNLQKSKKK